MSNDGKTAGLEASAQRGARSEHIPTPEGRGGETLTTLLRRAKQTLCVPAAEYVPAMGDAMLLLDKAIQMSYQTDPNWLLSSPWVEGEVIEAEYLRLEAQLWDDGAPARLLIEGAADTIERLTRERNAPRVEEVRREALEEAAKVVEPTNGPPCDCITLHDDEWWMPHCDCRNGGDSDEAQSWCTSKNEARRIRALSSVRGE